MSEKKKKESAQFVDAWMMSPELLAHHTYIDRDADLHISAFLSLSLSLYLDLIPPTFLFFIFCRSISTQS